MDLEDVGPEDKFFISEINDTTIMLFDPDLVDQAYLLSATHFQNSTHISLSLVESLNSHWCVSIVKELWSTDMYVANLIDLMQDLVSILNEDGVDIENPVPLVLNYGGYLLGDKVHLPRPPLSTSFIN